MEKKTRRQKNTEYQRTYRQNHPERISAGNRAYYEKNKEAIRAKREASRASGGDAVAAEAVRRHRRSLGLSQEKYARLLGITQALLSLWERGLSPVNMDTVAAAFPEWKEGLHREP